MENAFRRGFSESVIQNQFKNDGISDPDNRQRVTFR